MSTCISSHGEYDAHETHPDTFVCKWCHEFDETGALAEIARLRGHAVTGMEHAIEKAARIIHGCTGDEDGAPVAARALAEAGLIATAPLREVVATNMFGEKVRRWATEWEPTDQNPHNTVVLANDVAAAEQAGYPRHRWVVVTPRNIKIGPRGMQARYAVAVDLSDAETTAMLVHDSVAPAFLAGGGEPQVRRVTAKDRATGDGRTER